jgi:hypothetical protein
VIRHRPEWDDNITMNLEEKGSYDVDCIHLAFVKTVMHLLLYKSPGISWLSEELLGSEEGLCTVLCL